MFVLLSLSALAAPRLNVGPGCPGATPILIDGLTPGGTFAVISSPGQGYGDVPAGACAGVTMDLSADLALRHLGTAPPSGALVGTPNLPAAACDAWIQVLELPSCAMSPAVPVWGSQVCPAGGASVLANPDFEAGTNDWASDGPLGLSAEAFAGAGAAEIDGNYLLTQAMAPVLVDDLVSATFWWWHWEDPSFLASGLTFLYYGDGSSEVVFSPAQLMDGWERVDLLPYLDLGKVLTGFEIYAGSTGAYPRSLVRFDNFSFCQ